jgi:hypothetical protein
VLDWVEFRRSDASAVIAMVGDVARAADPGEHGDGVEVVIQAPRPGFLERLFGDHTPDQARILVSRPGGEVRYPYNVQLVTDHGPDAAHRVPKVRGWASSNSAGLALLVQKGRRADPPDWAGLVGGAVAALSALRPEVGDRGWKAAVDRSVNRAAGGKTPAARGRD